MKVYIFIFIFIFFYSCQNKKFHYCFLSQKNNYWDIKYLRGYEFNPPAYGYNIRSDNSCERYSYNYDKNNIPTRIYNKLDGDIIEYKKWHVDNDSTFHLQHLRYRILSCSSATLVLLNIESTDTMILQKSK
jgi:hypothetical protein